jgi:hypothetical protein
MLVQEGRQVLLCPRVFLCGISVPLFSELHRETVRTGSEEPAVWPQGPPKQYFSAHFGLPTPPESTLKALLVPLFGQFQKVHSSKPVSTILNIRVYKCGAKRHRPIPMDRMLPQNVVGLDREAPRYMEIHRVDCH